jgi:hypothetical protein
MSFLRKSVFWAGLACLVLLVASAFWWNGKEKNQPSESTVVKPQTPPTPPLAGSDGSFIDWVSSWGSSSSSGERPSTNEDAEREVEAAVKKTYLAYNAQDLSTFLAGWTDRGFKQAYERPKDTITDFVFLSLLSFRPYKVGQFSNTAIYGASAETEVELLYGAVQESHRMSLLRDGETWKIDHDEKLAKFPTNATVIDVKLQFFKIQLDPAGASPGTVAFKISNTDARKHEMIVKKWLPDSDQEETIGLIKPLDPGKSDTLVLANLTPGKYIVLCNMVTRDAMPYAYGMRNEFIVQ